MNDNTVEPMQPTLTGRSVELRPLQQEHAQGLLDAAPDGQLWTLKLTVVPGPETIGSYIATALDGREAGTVMPFVIVRRDTGAIVGSTRVWKIDRMNRKLEIGHTWLSNSVRFSIIDEEWAEVKVMLEGKLGRW